MAGYQDRTSFDPLHSERKRTPWDWAAAGLSVLMAAAMLFSAYADGKSAPAWAHRYNFGIAPMGVTELLLAGMFLMRARSADTDDRYSPRSLRLTALLFLAIGTVTVAFGLYSRFKGA